MFLSNAIFLSCTAMGFGLLSILVAYIVSLVNQGILQVSSIRIYLRRDFGVDE